MGGVGWGDRGTVETFTQVCCYRRKAKKADNCLPPLSPCHGVVRLRLQVSFLPALAYGFHQAGN